MAQSRKTISKPGYLLVLPWSLDSLGGVSQVVENLIIQIERYNVYTPILMVNSWEDRIIRKAKIQNREHYLFRLRSIYNNKRPIKNLFAFFLFFFSEFYNLHRFLKAQQVSVVNVHYGGLSALNFSILKILGLYKGKLLVSFHGKIPFTSSANGPVAKQLWKLLLRTSNRAITCSEALKQDVATIDNQSVGKIIVIHNGINTEFLDQERDRNYHLDKGLEGRKFVLNVATFEPHKGQDILLKAFAKIESLFPEVDLVMVGRPEEALQGLKSLVQDLGLERRVWLYDGLPHSQMAAFYEKATIFALPSRYEPFGIVILEAGLFGVPVVATRVGGISEILDHDQTGRLCTPGDPEILAKELKLLLENSDERDRLGRNLQKHVIENFTWEKAYLKYNTSINA